MLGPMGYQEILIIGIVAVLLFGKNLPDVMRKLGKSYFDFRKGLSEMQSQMRLDEHSTSSGSSSSSHYEDDYDDYEPPTAPKFEPPTSEPTT